MFYIIGKVVYWNMILGDIWDFKGFYILSYKMNSWRYINILCLRKNYSKNRIFGFKYCMDYCI